MPEKKPCGHCGENMPAKDQFGTPRTYCSLECSKKSMRGKSKANPGRLPHEHNLRAYESWLADRERRLAAQRHRDQRQLESVP